MSDQLPNDCTTESSPLNPTESDVIARLDFQKKILERILNAAMVSSNVAREIRTGNENGTEKLRAVVSELAQTGERREAKTQATFDAFQRAFREEIAMLRNGISTVLREHAFLQMAGSWMSVLDDVDDLAHVSGSKGAEAWSGALQALASKIISIIASNGLSPLPITAGETRFDPERHEAMGPSTPEEVQLSMRTPPGVIVAVRARGFLHGERIYRCARVVVASSRAGTDSVDQT